MDTLLPLQRMNERVNVDRDISDASYFNALMYKGELVTKLVSAGMVATIDDRVRQQYRLKYDLVRGNGLGSWANAIEQIISGVPNTYIHPLATSEVEELDKATKNGEWQYECLELLQECQKITTKTTSTNKGKLKLRSWFSDFVNLRNKTRGHGASLDHTLSAICPHLDKSINLLIENFILFKRGWAFLSQTQKSKYRVVGWNDQAESLNFLRTREGLNITLEEGVYIHLLGQDNNKKNILKVDLIYSDIEASDFYFPNGGSGDKNFELISYITAKTLKKDIAGYDIPIGRLPDSETQGLDNLEQIQQYTIVNLPPLQQKEYISRTIPEDKLYGEIIGDNEHRIITLIGRGGIGKTSLTLKVLNNKIAPNNHFSAILWFSARDIDLLSDGAKQVHPHILTEKDIADEFTKLVGPYIHSHDSMPKKDSDKLEFVEATMKKSELGGGILFVFDNFETVKSPNELYKWIDTHLRLPNKAVITSRSRDFKGDYPIELTGMSFEESEALINRTASRLQIQNIVTDSYIKKLYDESDGHPYIIKVLLGEVKKSKKVESIKNILARRDDILDALFERTYNRLSVDAQRVFLDLCSWESHIPQLAMEAILLSQSEEEVYFEQAVEDLLNSSLIESISTEGEEIGTFLFVPLVTRKFGLRKLSISRLSITIKTDVEWLKLLGASKGTDLKHGIQPRIKQLLNNISNGSRQGVDKLEESLHIFQFIAKKYPPTWLMLATEFKRQNKLEQAEQMYKDYLEYSTNNSDKRKIWQELIRLYSSQNKYDDEVWARSKLIELPNPELEDISDFANRINNLFATKTEKFNRNDNALHIVSRIIATMERKVKDFDATDCSRLGWLYLHQNNKEKARNIAEKGLEMDDKNEYCDKLLKRINSDNGN